MTDEELKAELHHWDGEIANATAWGASVAAADEFRRNVHFEMELRASDRYHQNELESVTLAVPLELGEHTTVPAGTRGTVYKKWDLGRRYMVQFPDTPDPVPVWEDELESSSLTKERTAMEDDLGIKMPYWTTLISEPRLEWLKAPSLHQKDGGNWMDAEPDIELASESLRQLTALKESFVVLNEKVLALITLIMTRF